MSCFSGDFLLRFSASKGASELKLLCIPLLRTCAIKLQPNRMQFVGLSDVWIVDTIDTVVSFSFCVHRRIFARNVVLVLFSLLNFVSVLSSSYSTCASSLTNAVVTCRPYCKSGRASFPAVRYRDPIYPRKIHRRHCSCVNRYDCIIVQ